jgi:hypothetical protein
MKFGPIDLRLMNSLQIDIKYPKDKITYKGKDYLNPYIRMRSVQNYNRDTYKYYIDSIEISFRGQYKFQSYVRFRISRFKVDNLLEENLENFWNELRLELL